MIALATMVHGAYIWCHISSPIFLEENHRSTYLLSTPFECVCSLSTLQFPQDNRFDRRRAVEISFPPTKVLWGCEDTERQQFFT
uniref:Secreted protein n=1 Tax=Steinernema glaseri TaxID=37863 RepID=A0A1I7Z4E0_9BILA